MWFFFYFLSKFRKRFSIFLLSAALACMRSHKQYFLLCYFNRENLHEAHKSDINYQAHMNVYNLCYRLGICIHMDRINERFFFENGSENNAHCHKEYTITTTSERQVLFDGSLMYTSLNYHRMHVFWLYLLVVVDGDQHCWCCCYFWIWKILRVWRLTAGMRGLIFKNRGLTKKNYR